MPSLMEAKVIGLEKMFRLHVMSFTFQTISAGRAPVFSTFHQHASVSWKSPGGPTVRGRQSFVLLGSICFVSVNVASEEG